MKLQHKVLAQSTSCPLSYFLLLEQGFWQCPDEIPKVFVMIRLGKPGAQHLVYCLSCCGPDLYAGFVNEQHLDLFAQIKDTKPSRLCRPWYAHIDACSYTAQGLLRASIECT